MLTLDRVSLQADLPAVRRDLHDCQAMHRTVLSVFPAAEQGESVRCLSKMLYRLDVCGDTPSLIVQSSVEPDWSRLPTGYAGTVLRERVDDAYQAGDRKRFVLTANPVKTISDRGFSPLAGKRVHLTSDEDLVDWLRRKMAMAGADLVESRVENIRKLRGVRKGAVVSLMAAEFSGTLIVVDPDLFRESVRIGIGPAKGYGMGLLVLSDAS